LPRRSISVVSSRAPGVPRSSLQWQVTCGKRTRKDLDGNAIHSTNPLSQNFNRRCRLVSDRARAWGFGRLLFELSSHGPSPDPGGIGIPR
jgi:hypothetical protein